MKKLLSLLVGALLPVAIFAGESWSSNINVGIATPINRYGFKEPLTGADADTKVSETGIALDASYLGIARNGFAVTGGFTVGNSYSSNFEDLCKLGAAQIDIKNLLDTGTDTNFRSKAKFDGQPMMMQFNFGAGYRLYQTERMEATALFMFGIGGIIDSYEMKYNDTERFESKVSAFIVDFGPAIHGVFHFNKKFGLFADVSYRYLLGSVTIKTEYGHDKQEEKATLYGLFQFKPVFGFCISF